jgi:predicted nuclease of restriction endonuclease-like (RecB) superfamily
MLFERSALSRKPEEVLKQELSTLRSAGAVTPDLVFRDPYVLDFLGLSDTYSERDLESAILTQLQQFIIELGSDFAFLARQKRILIDNEDFKIDLLFYHRGLKRLVAIDLKLGRFKAAYKGQMELYLKWLDKYERKEGEESPIGLILCAEKSEEQIELLELNKGHIRVSEYLTQLPPKEVFASKLHKAIQLAQLKKEDWREKDRQI